MYTAGPQLPWAGCAAQIVCVSYEGPQASVEDMPLVEAVERLSRKGALCRIGLARDLDGQGLTLSSYQVGAPELAIHALVLPAMSGAVATGMRLLRDAEERGPDRRGTRSTLRFLLAYTGVLAPLAGLHVYLVWRSMFVPRGVLLGTGLALAVLGTSLPVARALDSGGPRLHPRALASALTLVAFTVAALTWALPTLACYSAVLAPYTSVDSMVTGTMILVTVLAPLGLLQVQDKVTALYVAHYALTLAAALTGVLAVFLLPILGNRAILVWALSIGAAVLCYRQECGPRQRGASRAYGWGS